MVVIKQEPLSLQGRSGAGPHSECISLRPTHVLRGLSPEISPGEHRHTLGTRPEQRGSAAAGDVRLVLPSGKGTTSTLNLRTLMVLT